MSSGAGVAAVTGTAIRRCAAMRTAMGRGRLGLGGGGAWGEAGSSGGRNSSMRGNLDGSSQLGQNDAMVDIDLVKLQGKGGAADGFSNQLANLSAEQQGDRLQRLERSMLRLERVNMEILAMLQKFVASLKR